MQWRSLIITPSHLANQCYSARIYVNHPQTWIGMTGSLPIYYYYTYSIKPGSGGSSHGSEFSWLNHWVHTAVVTRKQQLISQPPVHSGSILTRLLITLHGKNILIRQVKRDLEAFWFLFSFAAIFMNFYFAGTFVHLARYQVVTCSKYMQEERVLFALFVPGVSTASLFISFVSLFPHSLPPDNHPPSHTHTHTNAQSVTKNAH